MTEQAPTVVIAGRETIVQAAGDTAQDAVKALGAQPVLLLIVLLNICMIGAGAWFLLTQEKYRHDERGQIIELISKCAGTKP